MQYMDVSCKIAATQPSADCCRCHIASACILTYDAKMAIRCHVSSSAAHRAQTPVRHTRFDRVQTAECTVALVSARQLQLAQKIFLMKIYLCQRWPGSGERERKRKGDVPLSFAVIILKLFSRSFTSGYWLFVAAPKSQRRFFSFQFFLFLRSSKKSFSADRLGHCLVCSTHELSGASQNAHIVVNSICVRIFGMAL